MDQFSKWAMHVRRVNWPGGALAVRLGLAILFVALLAGLYLVQASQMSSIGRRLETMRADYNQLRRDNAELLYQISQEGNVVHLQQRSAEMGLIPAERIEYLPVDGLTGFAPASVTTEKQHDSP
jgi:hypothetical protein